MSSLKKTDVEHYSGYNPNLMGLVEPIREGYYKLADVAVSGNAPKDFIRIYEYGEARKDNPQNWPAYIAKVGHKWYPNESITEQFMTRVGQELGFRVADSKLMLAKGQLRFLSKYFLNAEDEQLVHGSEIFSAHFEDEDFVQQVDDADKTKELFTFQSIEDAITDVYPDSSENILTDFVKMLFFDAIVGNNDRHFENWGVIESIKEDAEPRFSPIYDTARGLFWNYPESNLDAYLEHESKLESYINGSMPTTGWDKKGELNHFGLLEQVIYNSSEYCDFILTFDFNKAISDIEEVLNDEFEEFFSTKRRCLIEKCLIKRVNRIKNLLP